MAQIQGWGAIQFGTHSPRAKSSTRSFEFWARTNGGTVNSIQIYWNGNSGSIYPVNNVNENWQLFSFAIAADGSVPDPLNNIVLKNVQADAVTIYFDNIVFNA